MIRLLPWRSPLPWDDDLEVATQSVVRTIRPATATRADETPRKKTWVRTGAASAHSAAPTVPATAAIESSVNGSRRSDRAGPDRKNATAPGSPAESTTPTSPG